MAQEPSLVIPLIVEVLFEKQNEPQSNNNSKEELKKNSNPEIMALLQDNFFLDLKRMLTKGARGSYHQVLANALFC